MCAVPLQVEFTEMGHTYVQQSPNGGLKHNLSHTSLNSELCDTAELHSKIKQHVEWNA